MYTLDFGNLWLLSGEIYSEIGGANSMTFLLIMAGVFSDVFLLLVILKFYYIMLLQHFSTFAVYTVTGRSRGFYVNLLALNILGFLRIIWSSIRSVFASLFLVCLLKPDLLGVR